MGFVAVLLWRKSVQEWSLHGFVLCHVTYLICQVSNYKGVCHYEGSALSLILHKRKLTATVSLKICEQSYIGM